MLSVYNNEFRHSPLPSNGSFFFQDILQIVKMYHDYKWTISAISRNLKISRDSVLKKLESFTSIFAFRNKESGDPGAHEISVKYLPVKFLLISRRDCKKLKKLNIHCMNDLKNFTKTRLQKIGLSKRVLHNIVSFQY